MRLASVNDLLYIRKSLPVLYPKKKSFNSELLPLSRSFEIVQLFPSNKAPGEDKLHMAVVKDVQPAILLILTEIMNSSLWTYVFPSSWKESEIVLIPKDGGNPEIAN